MSTRSKVRLSIGLGSSMFLCAGLVACDNTHLQTMAGTASVVRPAHSNMYSNLTAAREISRMPGLHSAIVIVHDKIAYVGLTLYMSGPVSNHKTAGATFMELGSDIEKISLNYFQAKISGGDSLFSFGPHYTGSVIGEGFLKHIDDTVRSSDPHIKRVLVTTDVQTRFLLERISRRLPSI